MKYIKYQDQNVSVMAAGCMRIAGFTVEETDTFIRNVLDLGINFFDHADIYGGGHCEELFGEVFKKDPSLRDRMFIQSKCGIRKGYFDFSYAHIMEAVEGILERLHTDHLDSLLLHRPDALMEAEEVDRAFEELHKSGKVLNFGVSNMNRFQMEYLAKNVKQELKADQLQLSIVHSPLIDEGLNVNMGDDPSIMRSGGTLEYLKEKDMVLQVWSPLQIGYFQGSFLGSEKYEKLNTTLKEMSEKYGVECDAIAYAWLLRLPQKVQVVTGTTSIEHLAGGAKAADILLGREDWYKLYLDAGNRLP